MGGSLSTQLRSSLARLSWSKLSSDPLEDSLRRGADRFNTVREPVPEIENRQHCQRTGA